VGAQLIHANRMGRQTDMKKLIGTFVTYANVHKNCQVVIIFSHTSP